jgi:hypothetical protein
VIYLVVGLLMMERRQGAENQGSALNCVGPRFLRNVGTDGITNTRCNSQREMDVDPFWSICMATHATIDLDDTIVKFVLTARGKTSPSQLQSPNILSLGFLVLFGVKLKSNQIYITCETI